MDRDARNAVRRDALKAWGRKGTKPYETGAKVVRTGKKPMVLLDGAEQPCEATLLMDSRKGDRVRVQVSNSKVRVTGNLTNPATDDRSANRAQTAADRAYRMADDVKETVQEAYDQAEEAYRLADAASTTVDGMAEVVDHAVSEAEAAKSKADGVTAQVATAVADANAASATATRAENAASAANDLALNATRRSIAAEQTINSFNVRTTVGDDESLIRLCGEGVMTGAVDQEVCALQRTGVNGARPSFDIVNVTEWVEGEVDAKGLGYVPPGEGDTEGHFEETDITVRKKVPVLGDVVASFGEQISLRSFDGSGHVIHEATMRPEAFDMENAKVSRYMEINHFAYKPRLNSGLTFQWIG